MLGQLIIAEVKVLHLLAVLTDYVHDVRELVAMDVDVAKVKLSDVRDRNDHILE